MHVSSHLFLHIISPRLISIPHYTAFSPLLSYTTRATVTTTTAVLYACILNYNRQFNVEKAYKMLCDALKWRYKRNPGKHFSGPRAGGLAEAHERDLDTTGWGRGHSQSAYAVDASERQHVPLFGSKSEHERLENENKTGKIYLAGFDVWQRMVVIFDNSVQNTTNPSDHVDILAFNLELAIRSLPPGRDKYVVFMHLDKFSWFNMPDLSTTKESALMLTTAFPERLGHCICYHPPSIFHTVFKLLKTLGLLDERTVKKIIFIYGDCSAGSANDLKLTDVVGPQWKELCGVDQPVHCKEPISSPGYVHASYWQRVCDLMWTIRGSGQHDEGVDDDDDDDKEEEEEEEEKVWVGTPSREELSPSHSQSHGTTLAPLTPHPSTHPFTYNHDTCSSSPLSPQSPLSPLSPHSNLSINSADSLKTKEKKSRVQRIWSKIKSATVGKPPRSNAYSEAGQFGLGQRHGSGEGDHIRTHSQSSWLPRSDGATPLQSLSPLAASSSQTSPSPAREMGQKAKPSMMRRASAFVFGDAHLSDDDDASMDAIVGASSTGSEQGQDRRVRGVSFVGSGGEGGGNGNGSSSITIDYSSGGSSSSSVLVTTSASSSSTSSKYKPRWLLWVAICVVIVAVFFDMFLSEYTGLFFSDMTTRDVSIGTGSSTGSGTGTGVSASNDRDDNGSSSNSNTESGGGSLTADILLESLKLVH